MRTIEPWSIKTVNIVCIGLLATVALGVAVVQDLYPSKPRQPPPPHGARVIAEQQRQMKDWVAVQRADPCNRPIAAIPPHCPGRSDPPAAASPLANRVDELESRLQTLENDQ